MSKTRLVALRDLKRRGKVEYEAGTPVPEKAFPDYQRDALLATGGLRRELVHTVAPKEKAADKDIPAEVASMYESPHDQPAKPKKAKKGKAG